MPERTTRTITRRVTLRVTELERRDTPAWWSVAAPVPAEGTVGVTDATHAGSLVSNPDYAPANGAATVWADTAALAVAKALAGTIRVTLPGGQSFEHAFGPATVGSTAADHKAYLAVVTGTSVALAFEDMAGQPGCDYDYNDRSWSGVSVAGASDPVVAYPGPHSWAWLNPDTADSATVGLEVTRPDDLTFRWTYTLANNNMPTLFASPGINQFQVSPEDMSGVTRLTSSMADWEMLAAGTMVYWRVRCMTAGPFLAVGGTATFGFDTPNTPITPATGGASVAGVDGGGTAAATMAADGDHPWAESSPSMAGPDTCVALEDGISGPTKGPGVVRVEITKWDGTPVGAAGLKVGKWGNAFDFVPTLDAQGQQAYDAQLEPIRTKIKPVDPNTGYDAVDLDPDRFNVWVYDKTKWTAKTPHIHVDISTQNVVGFTQYTDLDTAVDLVRFTGNAKGTGAAGEGWFWSDSQLLVSNVVDDEASVPGVGADDSGPGALGPLKNGYRWDVSDRTHMVALRGSVIADYVYIDCIPGKKDTKPVPAKHTVGAHVNILNAPNAAGVETASGVITVGDVNDDFTRANEQYAQVGVVLIPDYASAAMAWPQNVFLGDGLNLDDVAGRNESDDLLLPASNVLVKAKIEVYYVNYMFTGINRTHVRAYSVIAGNIPSPGYQDSVVISVDDRYRFTIAHEIGHVLAVVSHATTGVWPINIMRTYTSKLDAIDVSKRFDESQDLAMNGNSDPALGPIVAPKRPNLVRSWP